MGLINNAPPPIGDAIAQPLRKEYKPGTDPQEGQVSQPWADWFTNLMANQEKAPGRVASATVTSQTASIPSTDLTDGSLSTGVYRLNYYLYLAQADSGSSDLSIVITWNDGYFTRTFAPAGMSKNNADDFQQATLPMRVTALTPINYAVTATFGLGDGLFGLDIWLEEADA